MAADCDMASKVLQDRDIESPLVPFARFVESSALEKLQEEYVATFDFNPAVALYLGHHLFGDNQKKGAYLIRLKQEFGRHGFTPSGNELPDHLPLVLGFLAHLARNVEDRSPAVLPLRVRAAGSGTARRRVCRPRGFPLEAGRRSGETPVRRGLCSSGGGQAMLNVFIFVVLPYVALALFLFVTPYRYFSNRLTWSAYSTQFLEQKALFWGSNPWHYGIIPVVLAHFLGVIAPGPMKVLLANQRTLILLESIGLGLGLFALFGCLVLMVRRAQTPLLKPVTSAVDWVLLVVLTVQAASGVYWVSSCAGDPSGTSTRRSRTSIRSWRSIRRSGTWPTSPWCSSCTRRGRS